MKRSIAAAALLVCLFAAGARAEQPDGWGRPGSVLLQGGFSFQSTTYDTGSFFSDTSSLVQLTVAPGFQVFVAGPVVVGAALQLTYLSRGSSSISSIAIQPSIGVNLNVGPIAALLPQVNFTFGHLSSGSSDLSRVAFGAYLPVIIHPVPHFFIGIGPDFSQDVSNSDSGSVNPKQTTFGVTTVLGGFF
jgi:hypothetical protein